MDQILAIPKDREQLSVLKLCLIMGMTALLFIMAANRIDPAAVDALQTSNY